MARAVKVSALRRQAMRQLKQRLDEGKLSAADLLRIVGMQTDDDDGIPGAGQDWVLTVVDDDGYELQKEDSEQAFAENN